MFSGFLNIWQVMLMDMSARYCAFGKLVGQFFLFLVSSVASGAYTSPLHIQMCFFFGDACSKELCTPETGVVQGANFEPPQISKVLKV